LCAGTAAKVQAFMKAFQKLRILIVDAPEVLEE
jgi:hypothetical protein